MKFEFYVLGWNTNERGVRPFNVFDNFLVQEAAEKAVKKYLRKVFSFQEFAEELDHIIQWQERARCEYEIMVGDLFETDPTKYEKWDAYQQCHPNIEMIAREVIHQYKEQKKHD